jgi:hypothetical protein
MDTDMMTDDEALREQGMTSGPTKVGRIKLRPMSAVTLSWMQRNHVFDNDIGDTLSKTAAYVFLHSEPKDEIRAVVNNREKFAAAVDDWMERTISHHTDLEEYSAAMAEAMEIYMASVSKASNLSNAPAGPKN